MLKTLGRETKGFRLVSVLTPIFMIAEVIMEMIIPKLMASIIDNGVTPGNMQVIYTVGAQMVVAALFGLLLTPANVLPSTSGSRFRILAGLTPKRLLYRLLGHHAAVLTHEHGRTGDAALPLHAGRARRGAGSVVCRGF